MRSSSQTCSVLPTLEKIERETLRNQICTQDTVQLNLRSKHGHNKVDENPEET